MLLFVFKHSVLGPASAVAHTAVNAGLDEFFSLLLVPVNISGKISRNAFGDFVMANFDPLIVLNGLLEFTEDSVFVLERFLLLFSQRLKSSFRCFGLGSCEPF